MTKGRAGPRAARPLATLGSMIDLRVLRENPEPYRASQRARGADVALVDRIIEADEARRTLLQNFESLPR